ncbi:Hypothetical protein FKW44_024146 [Caligus rogercresseyi]|uniref:Uncharacterized protein n=1 Tax=Caligus rogercresseyi TaxID=217165 RepID=A0A7T8JTN9_CALRO|nr:Hypothetical protein FKW44_024883 [Caligus rogercresseyi]QQP32946.1 Hypothetical protein FKW44_024146 [Caligus rogercresseyi]
MRLRSGEEGGHITLSESFWQCEHGALSCWGTVQFSATDQSHRLSVADSAPAIQHCRFSAADSAQRRRLIASQFSASLNDFKEIQTFFQRKLCFR